MEGHESMVIYQASPAVAQTSVAATRPAVSRLTKPRLVSDSTGPTAPYLLESRLRLGRNFQSTQVFFFLSFFFFPKLHLAAYKEAQSTFILLCQYPMRKLQTSHFHMDRSSRQPSPHEECPP